MKLGVAAGNTAIDLLKVGERFAGFSMPIPSQAPEKSGEGVETGWAASKGLGLW